MNIAEIGRRSKAILSRVPQDTLYLLVLVLAATGSFSLGMLTEREAGQGRGFAVEETVASEVPTETMTVPEGAQYVGSKNGTKYHLPWCSGAKSINEENKVWFATKEEAEAKGYTPAGNCKGI